MAACVEIHSRGIIIPIRSLLSLSRVSFACFTLLDHARCLEREREERNIGKYISYVCVFLSLPPPFSCLVARDKGGDRMSREINIRSKERDTIKGLHYRSFALLIFFRYSAKWCVILLGRGWRGGWFQKQ